MPLFIAYDAWVSALCLGLLMLGGWWAGARFGGGNAADTELSRFDDGALALFGLLLAFCFSGAAARYDTRKQLVLAEATAIGDFAGTAALMAEPQRTQLLREVHAYTEQRLSFGKLRLDDPAQPTLERQLRALQNRIGALVAACVQQGNTPSAHEPLIDTFNAMSTALENRAQGLRDHMPESIVCMLFAFAIFSTFTMGRAADGKRLGSAIAYTALVALVFWVTMDLEHPRRGLLRVSQRPMLELAAHLPQP
jgi:hypothetical protein